MGIVLNFVLPKKVFVERKRCGHKKCVEIDRDLEKWSHDTPQIQQAHINQNVIKIFSHYSDVTMSAMASQITGVSTVRSTVCSGADQRNRQSSASLAFVKGINRRPVNFPHKGSVTRNMFPLDDAISVPGF